MPEADILTERKRTVFETALDDYVYDPSIRMVIRKFAKEKSLISNPSNINNNYGDLEEIALRFANDKPADGGYINVEDMLHDFTSSIRNLEVINDQIGERHDNYNHRDFQKNLPKIVIFELCLYILEDVINSECRG